MFKVGMVLVALLMLSLGLDVVYAEPARRDVKFYKINKKNQLIRYHSIRKVDQPGCHNLRRKLPVHRFSQIGFADCRLFKARNCDLSSQLSAIWSGKKYRKANIDAGRPQLDLPPGSKWLLALDGNRLVHSWHCRLDNKTGS